MAETISASARIFERIIGRINNGEYDVGGRLPSESELCAEFGVSRGTVRAALQRLQALGLIKSRPGGGYYLRSESTPALGLNVLLGDLPMKPSSLIEFFEFRRDIDALAAEYAAQRATPEDLAAMDALLERLGSHHHKRQCMEYSECDFALHARIGEAAHNSFITRTMNIVTELIRFHVEKSNQYFGIDEGYRDHIRIVDAIRRKDVKAAFLCAGEHAEASRRQLVDRLFQKRGTSQRAKPTQ